jgi:hypothetical protein
MEKIREETLHPNIQSAMDIWMEGIRKVQARRREEIVNAANRQRSGSGRRHDDKGTLSCVNISIL